MGWQHPRMIQRPDRVTSQRLSGRNRATRRGGVRCGSGARRRARARPRGTCRGLRRGADRHRQAVRWSCELLLGFRSSGHGETGAAPLGEAIFEAAGPVATASQLTYRVVCVYAVRAAAVGNHLMVFGYAAQATSQLGERHRPGPRDVACVIFGSRPYIEYNCGPIAQSPNELGADNGLESVAVADVGVDKFLEAGESVRG